MDRREQQPLHLSFYIIGGLILAAALSRIVPHPYNFTPVVGMTLFGAALFKSRWMALAIPFAAMWISDLLLNNLVYATGAEGFIWMTPGAAWVYGSILLIGVLGFLFFRRKISWYSIVGGSLSGSVLFFLITNFGVWMQGTMYSKTWSGLMACYTAGIPFFQNALAGDLFYCGVLFGSYYLIRRYALEQDATEAQSIL